MEILLAFELRLDKNIVRKGSSTFHFDLSLSLRTDENEMTNFLSLQYFCQDVMDEDKIQIRLAKMTSF